MTYPIEHLKRAATGQFEQTNGSVRDGKILAAAVQVAETMGLRHVTRAMVAQVAKLSVGSVSNFERTGVSNVTVGSIERLRAAVVTRAVAEGRLRIVAEALGVGHPVALAAPEDIKARALAGILHG